MIRPALVGIAVLMLSATAAHADPDTTRTKPGAWSYGATVGLNLSQSAYSANWNGGDKGSINWVLQGDLTAERQMSRWFHLLNTMQLSYGQTAKQVVDSANTRRIVFDSPEKTTDLILLESTGRFTLDTWVDPFVGLRLESQFSDQSDPRGPIHLNPLRVTETAGGARELIKDEDREWITRLGFSIRETFSRSFADSVGLGTQGFTSNDGGIEWLTTVQQPLLKKRVLYKGRLLVYLPLFFDRANRLKTFDERARAKYPAREAVQDFWKAPNVNFQNTFTAPLAANLNVNLYVQWIYQKLDPSVPLDLSKPIEDLIEAVDGSVRKAGQFKQTLAIGFTYTLF